jgi:hypothetical protein
VRANTKLNVFKAGYLTDIERLTIRPSREPLHKLIDSGKKEEVDRQMRRCGDG